MALLPPKVVGPLSECNTVIELQGQLTSADIEIRAFNEVVATGKASAEIDVFPLLPNKTLKPGDEITATQKMGADPSPPSPEAVVVQKKPPQIGSVIFTHPIFRCGVCAGLAGAVPGASVEVKAQGDPKPRGTGISPNGGVGLGLKPATGPNDLLVAAQTACGQPGAPTNGPAPKQPPAQLPPPVFLKPLLECQSYVAFTNVLPGAVLTLTRANWVKSGCFVGNVVYFPLQTPLNDKEKLTAKQEFPGCHSTSPDAFATVQAASPVPPPVVIGPLCAGATTVPLANLIPGAHFRIKTEITVGGKKVTQDLGTGQAPGPVYPCPVPPNSLNANYIVTAQQQLCGVWSKDSNQVTVAAGGKLPMPSIPTQLVACGGAVRVNGTHPGAWVFINSTLLNAPIGEAYAYSDVTDVPVNPLLLAGDDVYAGSAGCGDEKDSKSVHVGPLPTGFTSPTVVNPVQNAAAVAVAKVVPGAFVDIYVNAVPRGGKFCAAATDVVPISGTLVVGDQVQAGQRLCAVDSGPGAAVKAVPPPPVAHFTAVPQSGPAPLPVTFTDQSTGGPTKWAWDFGDKVGKSSVQKPPPYTYKTSGTYTASLTVSNKFGSSKPFFLPISVQENAAPFVSAYLDQPMPPETIVKVKGLNFTPNAAVIIHVTNDQDPPDDYQIGGPGFAADQFGNFDLPTNYTCMGTEQVTVEVEDLGKNPAVWSNKSTVKC